MKKFAVHPIGLLIWCWLLLFSGVIVAVNYVFAIILHEMGHYFVAKRLGYRLTRFAISPFGVELSYFDQKLQYKDEIKIALAGPAINLVSSFLICGLWWVLPTTYFLTESFVVISCILALVNLLPAYPLDGGRIFVCCCNHFVDEKKATKITMMMNVFFSILFLFGFVICLFYRFNPTLLAFSIFLFSGLLQLKGKTTFDKINWFAKEMKNFVKPDFLCVNLDTTIGELMTKIQSSKTTIFVVSLSSGKVVFLTEKMLIKLSINYGIKEQLKNIFEK